jgi:hypothetical protein
LIVCFWGLLDPDPLVRGPDHQAKIVSKTLIPTVLWLLYDFLFQKNDVNVPSKNVISRSFLKQLKNVKKSSFKDVLSPLYLKWSVIFTHESDQIGSGPRFFPNADPESIGNFFVFLKVKE